MALHRILTGPACWASALVNGDQSSLTTNEVIQLNAWRAKELERGESIAGTADDAEPRFTRSFRLYGGDADCGEVLDYVVLRAG